MPEVIIHVGTHKTGSTSLQNALYANEKCAESNYLYPRAGLLLDSEVGARHGAYSWDVDNSEKISYLISQLVCEIEASNKPFVVLSYEGFSTDWGVKGLRSLVDALSLHGYNNVKLVCYLRNKQDYVISYYREFVRRRGMKEPFDTFLEKTKITDYYSVLERLELISTNISLNLFDGIDDIPSHFMSAYLGIEIVQNTQRANTSLSAKDVESLRHKNEGTLSKNENNITIEHVTRKDITLFTRAQIHTLAVKYGLPQRELSKLDNVSKPSHFFSLLRKFPVFRV